MNSAEIIGLSDKYIAPTYARFGVAFTKGEGSLLYDADGKKYIDLGSGIAVNAFGIADKEWAKAVSAQLLKVSHTSNLYYTEPQAKLAKALCERSGLNTVFFSNSGAEANECAIKAARKYSHDKYGSGRYKIITLNGSFHGRTITTLAATGQENFHTDFMPFTPGFVYIEPNNIEALKSAISNDVSALMVELIQGESGVNPLDKDYVLEAAKICAEKDILLIVDEVQTGNGRTGKYFCFENYRINPDIVTTAKGLGGGLPIGATLFGEKVKDTLGAGKHGSTFGGNPVCAAGALNVVSRINDKLLCEVSEKSELIKKELSGVSGVKKITGIGLMIGIETEKPAKEVALECLEKGVLVLTAKDKVRLLPALNIPTELLKEAVEILKGVIEK